MDRAIRPALPRRGVGWDRDERLAGRADESGRLGAAGRAGRATASAGRAAVRRRPGPPLDRVPAAPAPRRLPGRFRPDRPQGGAPPARHRAQPTRVRPSDGRRGVGGGAGPARGLGPRPAQQRLLGGGVRRPDRRRGVVLAVRGAPPVGHHDRARRRGLPGAGVPRRQPGARCSYAGRPVVRPLAPEEDLARALLDALGPAGTWPRRSSPTRRPPTFTRRPARGAHVPIEPRRIAGARLGPTGRALLDQLVALYLARLPPTSWPPGRRLGWTCASCTSPGRGRPDAGSAALLPGAGPDLLIEYDNTTDDGNHAHTVLRRPASDFGDDILSRHRAENPHSAAPR